MTRRLRRIGPGVVIGFRRVGRRAEKTDQTLVDDRLADDLRAGKRADSPHQLGHTIAATLDQCGDAVAPELAKRRVRREPARSARPFGVPVELIASIRIGSHIGRTVRHRRAMRGRVTNERVAGIEGHVEPLVTVGRPRIGVVDARDEMRETWARGCPQAEGAVDMRPCAETPRNCGTSTDVVERTRVDVARLQQHDRGRVAALRQLRFEGVQTQTPLRVERDEPHLSRADAEHTQRAIDRTVTLIAGQHADRRCSEESVGLDVPVAAREQRVARRSERGEVRGLTAGHKREARLGGKTEHILEPGSRGFFDDCGGRGTRRQRRVLITDRGEPIRSQRGGKRSADHPGEEPPSGRAHEAAVDIRHQLPNDVLRRASRPLKGFSETRLERRHVDARPNRPIRQAPEILERSTKCGVECGTEGCVRIVHAGSISARVVLGHALSCGLWARVALVACRSMC